MDSVGTSPRAVPLAVPRSIQPACPRCQLSRGAVFPSSNNSAVTAYPHDDSTPRDTLNVLPDHAWHGPAQASWRWSSACARRPACSPTPPRCSPGRAGVRQLASCAPNLEGAPIKVCMRRSVCVYCQCVRKGQGRRNGAAVKRCRVRVACGRRVHEVHVPDASASQELLQGSRCGRRCRWAACG